jgi:hypothetical protein
VYSPTPPILFVAGRGTASADHPVNHISVDTTRRTVNRKLDHDQADAGLPPLRRLPTLHGRLKLTPAWVATASKRRENTMRMDVHTQFQCVDVVKHMQGRSKLPKGILRRLIVSSSISAMLSGT